MNTAQGNLTDGSKPVTASQPVSGSFTAPSPVGKEGETLSVPKEAVQEVVSEIELTKEVVDAGVEKQGDVIVELPPDVKKLGVIQTGSTTPLVTSTPTVQVSLPISDNQVVVGLHAQVTSALRWLALWCVKKLAKAHLALKVIHGKIVRVPQKL